MHPVDPKNTRGARDLRRIPTGIEMRAAPTENIHELREREKISQVK
jgi:hypothetical protein